MLFKLVSPFLMGLVISSIVSAEPATYRIGVIAPLTGNFANYGAVVRQGIEKIQNPHVQWVFEDDQCDAAKSVAAYKKLVAIDQVSYVIGPCCGSPQKAVAPLLKDQKRLILLPNAAPASVFMTSGNKMYSVQYSLESDGEFLAHTMNARGYKRVAIVYVDNDFSQTLDESFRKAFKGSVVYAFRAPGFDTQYMKAAAVKLKQTDFDALFVPDAAPFLLAFLTELHKLGVQARPTYSVYAAQMPDVLLSEKGNAEGLLYSYPDLGNNQDAFGYFPTMAAKLLSDKVVNCAGAYDCVAQSFASGLSFQHDGTLKGNIVLKTVHNGQFEIAK